VAAGEWLLLRNRCAAEIQVERQTDEKKAIEVLEVMRVMKVPLAENGGVGILAALSVPRQLGARHLNSPMFITSSHLKVSTLPHSSH
jgi:hypothetical protein